MSPTTTSRTVTMATTHQSTVPTSEAVSTIQPNGPFLVNCMLLV